MPAEARLPVRVSGVLLLWAGAGLSLAGITLLLGTPLRRPGAHWIVLPGLSGWAAAAGLLLLALLVRRRVRALESFLVGALATASGASAVGFTTLAFGLRPAPPGAGAAVVLVTGTLGVLAGVRAWERGDPDEGAEAPSGLEAFLSTSLGVAALLLALGLPSYHEASQRRRQLETLGSVRTFMVAVESYAVDHRVYPVARSTDELAPLLEPTHVHRLPRRDGWGWPIDYSLLGTGSDQHFYVRSPGADGLLEHARADGYRGGPVEGFERDIVYTWARGAQFPDGTMAP